MSSPIRIVIADDHPLIRQGLAAVLGSRSDIKIVGEARNGEEAVRQVESLDPDILIIDLDMPVMDGTEAIRLVGERAPRTRSMVLTAFDSDAYIFPGLEAGATSYILKDASPSDVIEAVRAVARGESPVEPRVASRILQRLNEPDVPEEAKLSEREIEVLQLASRGTTNRGIAEKLVLSENTIKSHLHRIFAKLDVSDRTQAVAEAVRRGLIQV